MNKEYADLIAQATSSVFLYGVFAGAMLSLLAFALLDFFNANRQAECSKDKGDCNMGACSTEAAPKKPAAKPVAKKPAAKAMSKPVAKVAAKVVAKPAAKKAAKKK